MVLLAGGGLQLGARVLYSETHDGRTGLPEKVRRGV